MSASANMRKLLGILFVITDHCVKYQPTRKKKYQLHQKHQKHLEDCFAKFAKKIVRAQEKLSMWIQI